MVAQSTSGRAARRQDRRDRRRVDLSQLDQLDRSAALVDGGGSSRALPDIGV
jgi:hypothetical protein